MNQQDRTRMSNKAHQSGMRSGYKQGYDNGYAQAIKDIQQFMESRCHPFIKELHGSRHFCININLENLMDNFPLLIKLIDKDHLKKMMDEYEK